MEYGTQMTQMWQMTTDFIYITEEICENPSNQRYLWLYFISAETWNMARR